MTDLPRLPEPCDHDHTRYIVVGSHLQICGHRHKTVEAAVPCLDVMLKTDEGAMIRASYAFADEINADHDNPPRRILIQPVP